MHRDILGELSLAEELLDQREARSRAIATGNRDGRLQGVRAAKLPWVNLSSPVLFQEIGTGRQFAEELPRSLKRRAKTLLELPRLADALTGSVCAVQRTDGALRLNVHLHVLALDGVYTEDTLSFYALPTPTAAEVSEIAERTAKRLHKAFQKRGRVSSGDEAAHPVDAERTDSLHEIETHSSGPFARVEDLCEVEPDQPRNG